MLWEWSSVISPDLFSPAPLRSYCNLPPSIALEPIGGSEKSCFTKLWQRHQTLLTRAWRKTPEHLVQTKKFTSILVLNNPDLLPSLSTFMTFCCFIREVSTSELWLYKKTAAAEKGNEESGPFWDFWKWSCAQQIRRKELVNIWKNQAPLLPPFLFQH